MINDDGWFSIAVQHEKPKGADRANWLRAPKSRAVMEKRSPLL
ncbi:DUF1214 domain-containing protein [Pseudomonas fluorescens]